MAAKDVASRLVVIAAAPVAKAVLELSSKLELVPLAHWGWDAQTIGVISYGVTVGGAAIGGIWKPHGRCPRTILIGTGLLVLVLSYLGYAWVASTPPPADSAWLYDTIGINCYFLTQLMFGFVVGHIVNVARSPGAAPLRESAQEEEFKARELQTNEEEARRREESERLFQERRRAEETRRREGSDTQFQERARAVEVAGEHAERRISAGIEERRADTSRPLSVGEGDDEPDPPRTAHAKIVCPDVVLVRAEFRVEVGLSAAPVEGVAGGAIVRPPKSRGPYLLDVQVLAHGFTLRDGESARHALPVTAAAPYPSATIHLTGKEDADLQVERAVHVVYSVEGQVVGVAMRMVRVVDDPADLAGTPPRHGGRTMPVPTGADAPDLTIVVARSSSVTPGSIQWTLRTPASLGIAEGPFQSVLGELLERYAKGLIVGVSLKEGTELLEPHLRGRGEEIARKMPREVRDAIRSVATHTRETEKQVPAILLLTEEPYVPWELAVLDLPGEPSDPPYLGARADVGRWVFGDLEPPIPGLGPLPCRTMAVVSGDYSGLPGWSRIAEATAEASDLLQTYGTPGGRVDARSDAVARFLQADRSATLVHFAVHGKFDPGGLQDGIVLTDGIVLDAATVLGFPLPHGPFVFLNACQVGAGQEVLGDYAGIAASFLRKGATGVVAPLWSIDDKAARGIATRFYAAAISGRPPAALLREERKAFAAGATTATPLAYQFFGHPRLRLAPVA